MLNEKLAVNLNADISYRLKSNTNGNLLFHIVYVPFFSMGLVAKSLITLVQFFIITF